MIWYETKPKFFHQFEPIRNCNSENQCYHTPHRPLQWESSDLNSTNFKYGSKYLIDYILIDQC